MKINLLYGGENIFIDVRRTQWQSASKQCVILTESSQAFPLSPTKLSTYE